MELKPENRALLLSMGGNMDDAIHQLELHGETYLYVDVLEEVLTRARAEGARSSRSTSAALSWDTDALGAHRAWSGQLCVGAVTLRPGGRWWFDATYLVRMQELPGATQHCGDVDSLEDGKAALERAWVTWLEIAGLRHV